MSDPAASAQALSLDQLPQLHAATKAISSLCRKQLRSYLDALGPLLRPRRVLGDYIEGSGRESVVGVDQNLAELRATYQKVAGRPFDIKRELATPIESISAQMQLYEWEYVQDVRTERGVRSVTVVSPLTWVIVYSSKLSFNMLRQVLAGKQERDPDAIRAFVLRACVLNLLLAKTPALADLFQGLRYRLEVRKSAQMADLPLVTLSAPVPCARPSDEVLAAVTGLTGGSTFEEVIDVDAARHIADPFQEQVAGILREHGDFL